MCENEMNIHEPSFWAEASRFNSHIWLNLHLVSLFTFILYKAYRCIFCRDYGDNFIPASGIVNNAIIFSREQATGPQQTI